ncbi:hypothetical protein I7I53_07564 [Histoplasma capsulatum var. duboisii H88]|uniref:Uncharacterized protein n=1 Tax=Ajellomyces capsulatus (strain H88) TaxID=544711 RepID=A0A8A1LHD7_AJEC8|nr:hypothetical protein I7I53_07564 [Histoplasma capsulatum var. duboisii H88]
MKCRLTSKGQAKKAPSSPGFLWSPKRTNSPDCKTRIVGGDGIGREIDGSREGLYMASRCKKQLRSGYFRWSNPLVFLPSLMQDKGTHNE